MSPPAPLHSSEVHLIGAMLHSKLENLEFSRSLEENCRSVSRLRKLKLRGASTLKRLAMLAGLLVHGAHQTRNDACHMELLGK